MKNVLIYIILICVIFPAIGQRNVVLIIADDLGTDYLGFSEDYQDTVAVPNIRSLLSRGVRFSNAMSNPVCSSTRAGILTGRYSFRTGVGYVVGGTGGSGELDTSETTIPKLLKNYNPDIARASIGKWHLHQPNPVSNLLNPLNMGYEHFEGPFIGQINSYTNWVKYTNGTQSTITNYATSENVNNALSWLSGQNGRPFFLWMAFNAPHTPFHLPPANLHSYTGLSGTQQDITQNPKPYFKAMIQALDTEIGRFIDSLEVNNQLDSTDIIFIGDNGNTLKTAQIPDLNKAKGTVYQYGVHVPFIIAGPSVTNPGRVSEALVNTADIFATILEMYGYTSWQNQIPANKPVDSKSLLPVLKNQTDSIRPWTFCETFRITPDTTDGKAMRNKTYKLLKFDDGREEFYHLATDPSESDDLLDGALTANETLNYNYLCGEMDTFLGNTNECTFIIRIDDHTLFN
ncbi:MAG: sulfatase-like hydrolase/transferase, partial [Bacteroidia bacterium]|nr:sulfatase-like hydrolase/transferase [Bacteroidia bacterium]